jgi:hypothetical protein
MPVDLPRSERRELEPALRPTQYAIDKGVGELDDRDIQAVQDERLKLAQRVSFVVENAGGTCGYTEMEVEVDGISGRDSIITLDTTIYQAGRDKGRTPVENARTTLLIASTMIHEAAHAAHFHLFGDKCEDFRDASLVAEAGFELESRIFGARPNILDNDYSFSSWQSNHVLTLMPSTNERTWRHGHAIRTDDSRFGMENSFLLKLCDDNFWSGEYVRRGAKALIPKGVAQSRPEGSLFAKTRSPQG